MWKHASALISVIAVLVGASLPFGTTAFAYPEQSVDADPALTIAGDISGYVNSFTDVPVHFQSNGHAINALTFAIAFDTSILSLNPSDVVFSLPAGFSGSAFLQPGATGVLNLSVFSLSTVGLPDGAFVTLPFTATCPAGAGAAVNADVGFSADPPATFGSVQGQDVPGSASGSRVSIDCTGPRPDVNHPPQARDDSAVTDEERSIRISVLDNDSDVDGDTLGISAFTQAVNGQVSVNGDRLTYRPRANFFGEERFTYTVSDGKGGVHTATVWIAVRPVNDAPTAEDDTATTDEDTPVTLSVLENDSDVDGDTLSVVFVKQPARGQAALEAGGVLRYTPPADFNGAAHIRYTVGDGRGRTATATVVVTVRPVNDPPTALDDAVITLAGAPVDVDVLANDGDVDGDSLTVTAVAEPDNGSATIQSNGQVRYTPHAGFVGIEHFSYAVGDGQDGESTANLTVIVQSDAGGASPVTARDDRRQMWEDDVILVQVLDNDSAAGGNALHLLAVTQPAHGIVQIEGQALRYTPLADYNGLDSFSYVVSDAAAGVDTAEVRIAVRPRNDSPTAEDDGVSTLAGESVEIPVLANDEDVDGDQLRLSAWEQDDAGQVRRNGGSLRYTPEDGFSGVDRFTYWVTDGRGGSATATVRVTVESVNHPPLAADDAAVTAEDTPVTVAVLANDSDAEGDPLAIVGVTPGVFGAVVSDGTEISYTPLPDFAGVDEFIYTISDGTSESTATVRVVINPMPDPPEPQADAFILEENGRQAGRSVAAGVTIDVLGNDVDRDGDPLGVVAVGQPDQGIALLNGDGSISYEAPTGFQGTAQFTYTVAAIDNSAITREGIVRMIAPQSGLVSAVADAVTTDEDAAVIVNVLDNDVHNGGGALLLLGFTSARFGTLTAQPDGGLRYQPDRDFSGEDSFTYIVGDGELGAARGTVTISVRAVNDAPQAKSDAAATDEDQPIVLFVLANDTDPENDTLSLVQIDSASNGVVADNSDGTITYTPQTDFFGEDSFSYTVSDGQGGEDSAVVRVAVRPVSDPPDLGEDLVITDEETPVTLAVLANDFDPDDDEIVVSGFTQPAQGTVARGAGDGLVYTPTLDFAGVDTFTYIVSDGVLTATTGVELTVNPVNDPPLARADVVTVTSSTPITVSVLSNDWDVDGDELLIESIDAEGVQGRLEWEDDKLIYTPLADFEGVERFAYVVSDGVLTDTGTVEVRALLAAAALSLHSQANEAIPVQPGQEFSYTLEVANTGRVPLTSVALRSQIPEKVTVLKVISSLDGRSSRPRVSGTELVWEMDMLELNQRLRVQVVLRPESSVRGVVEIDADFSSEQLGQQRAQPIRVQVGEPVGGQAGHQIFLPTLSRAEKPVGTGASPVQIYLPHIGRAVAQGAAVDLPDLVIEQLTVTEGTVELTLINRGGGSVTDEFWVDMYIAPTAAPTRVNQIWSELAGQGLVWGVTASALPIDPGSSLTLRVGDAYYSPAHSTFSGGLPVGTPLFAQVDSFNPTTSFGAVLEGHEVAGDIYNNIAGPVLSVASGADGPGRDGVSRAQSGATFSPLPVRPVP